MNGITRRLAAVAFADVAGWTRLVGSDELAALHGWRALRDGFIEPKIKAHGGRLVDTAGDAVFVEFPSAVDALRWALELQARPDTLGADAAALHLRVGINVGDLLVDEQHLVGDEVNIASRIHQLAAPGEIVVTDVVRQHVAHRLGVSFLDLGEQQLKNVNRPVHVFVVRPEAPGPGRAAERRQASARACLAIRPPALAEDADRAWRARVADAVAAQQGEWLQQGQEVLVAQFAQMRDALQAAWALRGSGEETPRMGLHRVQGWPGAADRSGAELAHALADLADPGLLVGSSAAVGDITPVLDADCEDLGERLLRGIDQPVRAYRLRPPGGHDAGMDAGNGDDLRPTLAVIPFGEHGSGQAALGEILADEIIGALSRSAELNVVSRLSTTGFRDRRVTLSEVATHLHATYVLSGAYRISAGGVIVSAELAEPVSGRVLWAQELRGRIDGIVEGKDELIDRILAAVSRAVVNREIERVRLHSPQSLKTGSLLIAAIALMHRLSHSDFQRARELLRVVIERTPRHAVPQAWMAKWHVLRVWQGWSDTPQVDTQAAIDFGKRALDNDSQCSLALTIDGFVHTNLLRSLDVAQQRYERALQVNPNDALAWGLIGMLHAFKGEGAPAVRGTRRGLRLSPLDPHRYFYDVLAAAAELTAGRHDRAISLAQRSLRGNRMHASTFRVLAISQWLAGQHDAARQTVTELMRIEPNLTVGSWLQLSPSRDFPIGDLCAKALQAAGVPP
jgi:class 3 adenylate cyclase/TolB-like protein